MTEPSAAVPQLRRRLPRRFTTGGGALFTAALVTLGVLVLVGVFAPLLAPADPNLPDLSDTLVGPSSEHLLGADLSGRDTLSRLIHGRVSACSVRSGW